MNHLQLGDRIWMARLEGGSGVSTGLDATHFEKFEQFGLQHSQTHHRAQVRTLLSQLGYKPRVLDLHRVLRPDPT